MSEKEVQVGGNLYRLGSLKCFDQLHVARRIAPIIVSLADVESDVSLSELATAIQKKDSEESALKVMKPVVEALSRMSDEDVEYVVRKCLKNCHRKQDTGWARVMSGSNFMFSDLNAGELIQLTVETIVEQMEDFFGSALQSQEASAPQGQSS